MTATSFPIAGPRNRSDGPWSPPGWPGNMEAVRDRGRSNVDAKCPIRPGEPCTLCQLDVTGPQDCGLVYLVMGDAWLREGLHAATQASTGRT